MVDSRGAVVATVFAAIVGSPGQPGGFAVPDTLVAARAGAGPRGLEAGQHRSLRRLIPAPSWLRGNPCHAWRATALGRGATMAPGSRLPSRRLPPFPRTRPITQ